MKTLSLQSSNFNIPRQPNHSDPSTRTVSPNAKAFRFRPATSLSSPARAAFHPAKSSPPKEEEESIVIAQGSSDRLTRAAVLGAAVTVGFTVFLLGADNHHGRALALGPEGPLVEEFWDNVRRYALYALTVSTGAVYMILQPIIELLKNPISAILIILILGGSFYIMSQVLSAMIGITEFSYDYQY